MTNFESIVITPQVSECGDKRCLTCSTIIEGCSVQITKDTKFTVKQNMTCDTRNDIYLIVCSGCNESISGRQNIN